VPRPDGADAGERRLQVVLSLLLIGLMIFTVVAFYSPALGVSVLSLPLDLVINTGATLAAAAVSTLAWSRYRETGERRYVAQSAAFLSLASVNALVLFVVVIGADGRLGFQLDDPGPLPIVAFVGARFVAAVLLVIGGVLALRGDAAPIRAPGAVLIASAVLAIGLIAGTASAIGSVDALLTPEAIDHLRNEPEAPLSVRTVSGGLLATQLVIGAIFLAAAWFAHESARRQARPADGYLAAGLVLAAFSQIHSAVNPGAYVSIVTTGDALRVAFYLVLLAGIVVQSRTDVRDLRVANVELARLRDAEVHRAMIDERGRLAREMHDGLAQDLWTARLKQGRLASLVKGEEQSALAEEVMEAIDTGIADARQAVMALRAGSTDAPLLEVMRRYAEDFGDRFALDIRFESTGAAPALPARGEAEVLRIVQEALNNVRKHADATVVRIVATATDAALEIVVTDNGRGFDPNSATSGFGLAGMRERAALIGARLDVRSAPRAGTRVIIEIPRASSR
jgi:signal transduction histidine kinase